MNILTTEEVQNLLKLNDRQAKALMRTDGFPAFKIGREYRVSEDDLMNWIGAKPNIKLDYSKC
jgi:excisionase family DNA binding protein